MGRIDDRRITAYTHGARIADPRVYNHFLDRGMMIDERDLPGYNPYIERVGGYGDLSGLAGDIDFRTAPATGLPWYLAPAAAAVGGPTRLEQSPRPIDEMGPPKPTSDIGEAPVPGREPPADTRELWERPEYALNEVDFSQSRESLRQQDLDNRGSLMGQAFRGIPTREESELAVRDAYFNPVTHELFGKRVDGSGLSRMQTAGLVRDQMERGERPRDGAARVAEMNFVRSVEDRRLAERKAQGIQQRGPLEFKGDDRRKPAYKPVVKLDDATKGKMEPVEAAKFEYDQAKINYNNYRKLARQRPDDPEVQKKLAEAEAKLKANTSAYNRERNAAAADHRAAVEAEKRRKVEERREALLFKKQLKEGGGGGSGGGQKDNLPRGFRPDMTYDEAEAMRKRLKIPKNPRGSNDRKLLAWIRSLRR